MPLPYIFASVTTIATPQFDSNFAALGALTPIPCTVAGTNALVLTPLANTPTVAAYQNYMQFTGIGAVTATGLLTAGVGSLPVLNVYADSSSGVTQAGTGSIVALTAFTLMYDSSLNSGAGGFHLLSAVAVGSFLPLAGGTLTGVVHGTSIALSGGLSAASGAFTGALSAASVSGTSLVMGGTVAGTTLFSGAAMQLSGAAAITGAATVGSLKIASGVAATRMLWTTATLTFSAISPNSSSDQTITVSGCNIGDQVLAGVPQAPSAGLVMFPFVSASNTVVMRALNGTTTTLTPPAGVYQASVIGFT